MKKLLILILLVSFFNCKNDKSSTNTKDVSESIMEDTAKELIVDINFKTNKEDVFKIILSNIMVDELQKKHITVVEEVSPNSSFESIVAAFGRGNKSKNLYINLGTKLEKEIQIKGVSIKYGKNSLLINPNEIGKYFVPNKFIEIKADGVLSIRKVDNKLNPQLRLKVNYLTELFN